MSDNLSFDVYHNIIDGKPCGSFTTNHAINPATREKLWEIPVATEHDVEAAVQAAARAFQSWKSTPFDERVRMLRAWGDAGRLYLQQFGEVVMKENGKPVC